MVLQENKTDLNSKQCTFAAFTTINHLILQQTSLPARPTAAMGHHGSRVTIATHMTLAVYPWRPHCSQTSISRRCQLLVLHVSTFHITTRAGSAVMMSDWKPGRRKCKERRQAGRIYLFIFENNKDKNTLW